MMPILDIIYVSTQYHHQYIPESIEQNNKIKSKYYFQKTKKGHAINDRHFKYLLGTILILLGK